MWITTWKKVYKNLLIVKFREMGTDKQDWTYFKLSDCDTEEECSKHTKEDMILFSEAKKQLEI